MGRVRGIILPQSIADQLGLCQSKGPLGGREYVVKKFLLSGGVFVFFWATAPSAAAIEISVVTERENADPLSHRQDPYMLCGADVFSIDFQLEKYENQCETALLFWESRGIALPSKAFMVPNDDASEFVSAGTQRFREGEPIRLDFHQWELCGPFSIRAACGQEVDVVQMFRDCTRPTIEAIKVNGLERNGKVWVGQRASVSVSQYSDDSSYTTVSPENDSDIVISGVGTSNLSTSGIVTDVGIVAAAAPGRTAYFNDLPEGRHEVVLYLSDICDDAEPAVSKSQELYVDTRAPVLNEPGVSLRNGILEVSGEVSDPGGEETSSGVRSIEVFLDDIPGEFSPGKKLCDLESDDDEQPVSSSFFCHARLSDQRRHRVIFVIKDFAGNLTRLDRPVSQ